MTRLQINPAFADLLQSNHLCDQAKIMHSGDGETVEDINYAGHLDANPVLT